MILFENDWFVAVEKAAGWLTIPGRVPNDTTPCLKEELTKQLKHSLWVVHRLDKEVGGVILFAKTAEAHREANRWFEGHQIEKIYEALSDRIGIEPQTFHWKSQLLRGKKRAYESSNGKHSSTLAEYVKEVGIEGSLASHWRLRPLTGRSHQLRFEMAKHGYPILGDILYGSSQKSPIENGIALRATELNFEKITDSKFGLPSRISSATTF